MSIDTNLHIIKQSLALEQEAGRVNSLTQRTTSQQRRTDIMHHWQAIQAELQPIGQAIKDLSSLAPEEPIKWAQSILKMSSCFVMEIDTTGLDDRAEICRITLANIDGSLFDDIIIKPSIPMEASATATNGVTDTQLIDAPSLLDIWSRIVEGLQGRYVVSFAQEWDRKMLAQAARINGLSPVYFLGEDLQRQLTQYYNKEYYIKLADISERMTGQILPEPATAIDRVKAQCSIIAGMAAGITDLRPRRQSAAVTIPPTTDDIVDTDALSDLDDHPF